MKNRKILLILLALHSCANIPVEPVEPDHDTMRFTGKYIGADGSGQYFKKGSTAGIYVGDPVNASNTGAVFDGSGQLVPASPIKWGENQLKSCRVTAYAPYDSTKKGSVISYKIPKDQSTVAGFGSAVLYAAKTNATPSKDNEPVELTFSDCLATISLVFQNKTESEIDRISVSEICGTVTVDMSSGKISSDGSNCSMIACASGDSVGTFHLRVAPQTLKFAVQAKMKDGSQYEFSTGGTETVDAGAFWTNASCPFVIDDSGPVDPEDLTKKTIPGIYSMGKPGVSSILLYNPGSDQYAYSESNGGSGFRIQNLEDGWMTQMSLSIKDWSEGVEATLKLDSVGRDDIANGSYKVTVQKVGDDGKVWLVGNGIGFIIVTEQI